MVEDGVVDGLYGADDEEAAGVAEVGDVLLILAEVLDFDGDVVRDAREFAMKSVDKFEGMLDTVEKIRITERDVLGAGRDLLAYVGEDYVAVYDAEDAFINRHDRAMTAEMLAAAAGLCRADYAGPIAGDDEVGVLCDRWHVGAVGALEREPLERNHRLGLCRR